MQGNITNLQLILHTSFSDNRVKSSSFWRGFKQRMPDPEKFFLRKICKSYYSVATFSGGLKKPLTSAQWIVKPPHCVILGKASERFPITVSCLSLCFKYHFFLPTTCFSKSVKHFLRWREKILHIWQTTKLLCTSVFNKVCCDFIWPFSLLFCLYFSLTVVGTNI